MAILCLKDCVLASQKPFVLANMVLLDSGEYQESCKSISLFSSTYHSLFMNVECTRNDGSTHNYNFDISKWHMPDQGVLTDIDKQMLGARSITTTGIQTALAFCMVECGVDLGRLSGCRDI
jgi:hypothetical protein